MKVKIWIAAVVCIALTGAVFSCNKKEKKLPSQMTTTELLDEYERLEYEMWHPRETYYVPSVKFKGKKVVTESKEQYVQRMMNEQHELTSELLSRELTQEEGDRFDSIISMKHRRMQEIIGDTVRRILLGDYPDSTSITN